MFKFLQQPADVPGSALPAIAVGVFVSFGGILFGYDTGTISGILAMRYWKDHFSTGYIDSTGQLNVSPSQQSLIVSILSAGTFLGALGSAPLADRLGRRWALICDSVVFIFGVILQTISVHIPLFCAGRFFAGLGVGLLSATVPLYQSETAPKWIRGTIVGCYQFSIAIGVFLSAIVANGTKNRNDTGSYRIPVAIQFLFALILIGGMLFLPETPRYLIRNGKYDAAARSLSRLRRLRIDHPALIEELAEIKGNHEYELSIGSSSYLNCFRKPIRKRLFTGCALQALQQLTGVNFIYYYGTSYFANSGIKNPFLVSVTINCCALVGIVGGVLMVDKMGRRTLMFLGSVAMGTCFFIVGGVSTALPGNTSANQALVAFTCLFGFFFNFSWGPCAWVVTGEIFPLKARAKALSMTTASNWLFNWALGFATPYLVNKGHGDAGLGSKIWFLWASFCYLGAVFAALFIYETKGLTLEQVDELYETVDKAWKSRGFVPKLHYADVEKMRGSTAILDEVAQSKGLVEPSTAHIEGIE
ncbi:putative glucose transporter rco-3 [Hyaloscypha variabilis]